MNTTVRTFILSNKNTDIRWKIDGDIYDSIEFVPLSLLIKFVFDWTVIQSEGIIEITTYYH